MAVRLEQEGELVFNEENRSRIETVQKREQLHKSNDGVGNTRGSGSTFSTGPGVDQLHGIGVDPISWKRVFIKLQSTRGHSLLMSINNRFENLKIPLRTFTAQLSVERFSGHRM